MRAVRLEARCWIGKWASSVNKECVQIAIAYARHMAREIPARVLRQAVFGFIDNNGNTFALICPHSQMSSGFMNLSSHRIPPGEGRALSVFLRHALCHTAFLASRSGASTMNFIPASPVQGNYFVF